MSSPAGPASLVGKVVLIFGGSSGMGKSAAGARVFNPAQYRTV